MPCCASALSELEQIFIVTVPSYDTFAGQVATICPIGRIVATYFEK